MYRNNEYYIYDTSRVHGSTRWEDFAALLSVQCENSPLVAMVRSHGKP